MKCFIPGKSSHHTGPLPAPVVAGVEGVMEVLAVGSNVSEHRVGDWVRKLLNNNEFCLNFSPSKPLISNQTKTIESFNSHNTNVIIRSARCPSSFLDSN